MTQDFEAYLAAAWPRLLRSAWLLTGDWHRAEDIVQGKLDKWFESVCLLELPYRDTDRKIGELITDKIATLGERVKGDMVVEATRAYFGVALSRDLVAMLEDGAQQLAKSKATLVERIQNDDADVTVQDRLRIEAFETEVQLRLSEARMSLAAESAQLALWEWDMANDKVWIQDKGLFGFSPDAPVDHSTLAGRVHPDDRGIRALAIERAMANGGNYESEFRVVLPGGDAPERVVFEGLRGKNWGEVALRVSRKSAAVADALSRAMTVGDHHEWVNMAATQLQCSGENLWQSMCAEWAKTLEPAQIKPIVDAINLVLD